MNNQGNLRSDRNKHVLDISGLHLEQYDTLELIFIFGLHNISGFIQDLDRFHQVFEIVKFHWLITVKSKSKHSHNLKPIS